MMSLQKTRRRLFRADRIQTRRPRYFFGTADYGIWSTFMINYETNVYGKWQSFWKPPIARIFRLLKLCFITSLLVKKKFKVFFMVIFFKALTEAKDICLYLKPLIKHLTTIEETDFSELIPLLKPLMHVVCLIWSHSRYYCNSAKIIVLLKQICNMLIQQVPDLNKNPHLINFWFSIRRNII